MNDDGKNQLEKLFALVKLMQTLGGMEKETLILNSSLSKHVHEEYQERQSEYNKELLDFIIEQCLEELKEYTINHLGKKYGGLITTLAVTHALIGIEMAHHHEGNTKIIQAINQDLDKALGELGVEVVWLKD